MIVFLGCSLPISHWDAGSKRACVHYSESWTIKKSWTQKNWYFQIMVLEKTLESPLDCKEIKPVNPERNHPWIFTGRTDAKAEAPNTSALDAKNRLIGKDHDAGKDGRQKEKGVTEDEMVGWHHQINGHECEQALGDSEEQGSLACYSPWGYNELDTI